MISHLQWTVTGLTLQASEIEDTFNGALTACFSATRWYLADLIHSDLAPAAYAHLNLIDAVIEATILTTTMPASGTSLTVTCRMRVTFPGFRRSLPECLTKIL